MRDLRGPALDWRSLEEHEYTRTVDLLVHREYTGAGCQVRAVDGRGGDGGIDILVTHPDGRTQILQLKFFLDGFPAKDRHRRRQIAESLATALAHQPDEWTLVVPCVLTPPEYLYIRKLREEHPEVEVTYWDRTRLDELLVRHRGVVDLMRRDPTMLEYAAAHGLEQSVLAGRDDLVARVAALGHAADTVDDWWTWDFSRVGDRVVRTLRAKHPDSATRSPVNLAFTADLDGHDELAVQMRRTLGYGIGGTIRLPGQVVRGFRIDGPPLVRQNPTDGLELELVRLPNENVAGHRASLSLYDSAGVRVGSHSGQVTDGAPGSDGVSLQVRFHQAMTATFLVPHDRSSRCTIELKYDGAATGGAASLTRAAAQLALDMAEAEHLQLEVGGSTLLKGRSPGGLTNADARARIDDMRGLYALADDLDFINRATSDDIPVPETITTLDRVYLRCLRLMLEGRTVMLPDAGKGTATLHHEPGDVGLQHLLDGPCALLLTMDGWHRFTAGRDLGPFQLGVWHPGVALDDAETVGVRLRAGEDVDVVLRPVDDTHFRGFMPDRQVGDDPEPPVAWALAGITEMVPVTGDGDVAEVA